MTYDEYMKQFDAERVKNDIAIWIRKWFLRNGAGCNAVVGISGGKDSAVVAALCIEALGKDRVIGVLMPNGKQKDIEDSIELVNHLDIVFTEVNISESYHGIINNIDNLYYRFPDGSRRGVFFNLSTQTTTNLPARIRMATLYAVSQSLNGRVANTCNLSEDWVGYSTRYGDSAGDFSPISMLTTDEVIAIGQACNLPDKIIHKTPSDGLCGKSDEDNLGFTYSTLNQYIRMGICDDEKLKAKIDTLHKNNLFKLKLMPSFAYKVTN